MSKPKRDQQTVTSAGVDVTKLPEGVTFKEIPTHVDERGAVCELFDARWDWSKEPLVFSYCFTVRPGKIKGWGMHKKHTDRYFVLFGDLKVVLYDGRPKSSTYGLLAEIYFSDKNRRLMNIPTGVWHAAHNIGSVDAVMINFPTIPYQHDNPDKYRLPLDTPEIPYSFDKPRGW